MESEADRRALLEALGGICYPTAAGQLLAVFDSEYMEAVDTETRSQVLTCTTEDVTRLEMVRKGASIQIGDKAYRVRRHEPDGAGMSRLFLES